jgi:hypothetical protein
MSTPLQFLKYNYYQSGIFNATGSYGSNILQAQKLTTGLSSANNEIAVIDSYFYSANISNLNQSLSQSFVSTDPLGQTLNVSNPILLHGTEMANMITGQYGVVPSANIVGVQADFYQHISSVNSNLLDATSLIHLLNKIPGPPIELFLL